MRLDRNATTGLGDTWTGDVGEGRLPLFSLLVDLPVFRKGGTAMDFRPLHDTERRQLLTALRGNAEDGSALLTDRRDTRFVGTAEDVTDEEVITAIRSVPCHY
jgi:hypothetical protein